LYIAEKEKELGIIGLKENRRQIPLCQVGVLEVYN
jgi:hypothetical protein